LLLNARLSAEAPMACRSCPRWRVWCRSSDSNPPHGPVGWGQIDCTSATTSALSSLGRSVFPLSAPRQVGHRPRGLDKDTGPPCPLRASDLPSGPAVEITSSKGCQGHLDCCDGTQGYLPTL